MSLEETAKAEVLEECGYEIPLNNLEFIVSFPSSVGSSGDNQTMFFAEVEDSMKVSQGGGLAEEGEMINVKEMSVSEVKQYVSSGHVNSPIGLLYAVNWFLASKLSSYQ